MPASDLELQVERNSTQIENIHKDITEIKEMLRENGLSLRDIQNILEKGNGRMNTVERNIEILFDNQTDMKDKYIIAKERCSKNTNWRESNIDNMEWLSNVRPQLRVWAVLVTTTMGIVVSLITTFSTASFTILLIILVLNLVFSFG